MVAGWLAGWLAFRESVLLGLPLTRITLPWSLLLAILHPGTPHGSLSGSPQLPLLPLEVNTGFSSITAGLNKVQSPLISIVLL